MVSHPQSKSFSSNASPGSGQDDFVRRLTGAGTTKLVGQIHEASRAQADGLTQVNQAMGEMNEVVHRTAATAEEAAAAAAELSAQAEQLEAHVLALSELVGGARAA